MMAKETTVTVSQIAELAKVATPTVSNWKRRFDDFPAPVRTAPGGRQLYSLAEIETWLKAHGRFDPSAEAARVLFELSDLLRDKMSSARYREVICSAITLVFLASEAGLDASVMVQVSPLSDIERELTQRANAGGDLLTPLLDMEPDLLSEIVVAIEDVDDSALRDLFELVLGKGEWYAGSSTNRKLTDLIVRLGAEESPRVILDPAAGEGGFLLAAAERISGSPALYGQEVSESICKTARQRMILHGIETDLRCGDSLLVDGFPNIEADVVFCDPPYGQRLDDRYLVPDARWLFGTPSKRAADYLWLQHAISHLTPEGRAFVLLPAGSLWGGGREAKIRQEMVHRGSVECVIMLPPGTATHTQVSLALWVVKRPTAQAPGPVLLVDVAAVGGDGRIGLGEGIIDRIVQIAGYWRTEGVIREPDRSIAVLAEPIDLLAEEANLSPSRWLWDKHVDPAERQERVIEGASRLRVARERLEGLDTPMLEHLAAIATNWVPVNELVVGDVASVINGVRVKPEDCGHEGLRALRTKDIGEGEILDNAPCYVEADVVGKSMKVTEPGDVILSPGSGHLRAVVDEVGGYVVVSPLQVLRFNQAWLDPKVAAASLVTPRNRRFVKGTSFARVNLRDLELPVLPAERAASMRQVLEQLEECRRAGVELTEAARGLRELLVDVGIATERRG